MNLLFFLIRCHEWTVEGFGRVKVCAPALLSSLCSSGLPKSRLCVSVCECIRRLYDPADSSSPPPPPSSLSAEEQRGRKLLVFCAPVLRCRRISFSVQLSNSKDFSVFLSHSSSSSSSSLQPDPSISARLRGFFPPYARVCVELRIISGISIHCDFLGIFSINARFQSELFVFCAPSEHLHGTFQATRTVSSERSRSLYQNGKFFFSFPPREAHQPLSRWRANVSAYSVPSVPSAFLRS